MSYEAWGDGDENAGYVTDERAQEMVDEATAELRAALRNCFLYAGRHRKEEWAAVILRFCAEGGETGSPLRNDAAEAAPGGRDK